MQYIVEPGYIKVMVGSSSEDILLCKSFEIIGKATLVEKVFFTPTQVEPEQ